MEPDCCVPRLPNCVQKIQHTHGCKTGRGPSQMIAIFLSGLLLHDQNAGDQDRKNAAERFQQLCEEEGSLKAASITVAIQMPITGSTIDSVTPQVVQTIRDLGDMETMNSWLSIITPARSALYRSPQQEWHTDV